MVMIHRLHGCVNVARRLHHPEEPRRSRPHPTSTASSRVLAFLGHAGSYGIVRKTCVRLVQINIARRTKESFGFIPVLRLSPYLGQFYKYFLFEVNLISSATGKWLRGASMCMRTTHSSLYGIIILAGILTLYSI